MEFDNRREYLRIRDAVQVRFRVLTTAEAAVESKARHERPSVHNLALIKALEEAVLKTKEEGGLSLLLLHKIIEIDDKLARILASLDRQPSARGPDRAARTINLSAGGCSLPPAPDLVPGVPLDLTLELPTFPPIAIRAVGVVVRSPVEAGAPSVAGISFEAIHEEDREMLYHYIFQRQREQIRESSRGHGVAGQSPPHRAK
jgi:PilZ domain-containing protein